MKVFEVAPGEEVIATLTRQASQAGVVNGAIVSLLGAVDACAISNMPAHDATQDIISEYHEPFELSGTGDIRDGKVHIHVTLSREGDDALGGHLHWAQVKTFFVRAYVLAVDNLRSSG